MVSLHACMDTHIISIVSCVCAAVQICTLSSLLPLPLLHLVPNSTGAEEMKRKADAESQQ